MASRVVVPIALTVLASLATGVTGDSLPSKAQYAEAFRQTREAREKLYPKAPTNRDGAIAWGESALLSSALSTYQATGDSQYLDYFVKRARQVLNQRDSATGAKDWAGRSFPAWSANGRYTLGRLEIRDTSGRLALVLETTGRSANYSTSVSLSRVAEGQFRLTAANPILNITESHILQPDAGLINKINASSELIRLYPKSWPASKSELTNIAEGVVPTQPMLFSVHTGMIAAPLARFAAIVKHHKLTRYAAEARAMAEAARKALACHDSQWTTDGEAGWYSYSYGEPTLYDGCAVPHNYTAAIGRAYVFLNRYSPQKAYQQRVRAIALGIKSDMKPQPDGSLSWHYWQGQMQTGWKYGEVRSRHLKGHPGNPAIEDTSHGAIEVQFVCLAHQDGLAFTSADIDALAATLTTRVLRSDCQFAGRVDGSGTPGSVRPGWVSLSVLRPYLRQPLSECLTPLHWLEQYTVISGVF